METKYDSLVAKFIASGSYISCLAAFAVVVFCIIFKRKRTSLRRTLILNLFIAGELKLFLLVVT